MVSVRWLSAGGSSSRKPASLFARLRVPGCSARVTGRSGGQPQRSEEKREESLKSFEQPSNNHRTTIEVPSKFHRNITLTSRQPHACSRLGTGWQCQSCTGPEGFAHWVAHELPVWRLR